MIPPAVHTLTRQLVEAGSTLPTALLADLAREAIAAADPQSITARARSIERSLLHSVVNATGVLLHTNLGRAPLSRRGADGPGYTNLEIDLEHGQRGSRAAGVKRLLRMLTGAEDVLVVNNGAAAVLLVLAALAQGSGVAVSRGELIEIGGGFRVPEILAGSGAQLVEVGTTNITRTADYARALTDPESDVEVILVVHQSNFEVRGFTARPRVSELAGLDRPVIVDLGSGLLDATTPWLPDGPPHWLRQEPAARQTLAAGAAAVTFSGDKLLGGPQAGIIAGATDLINACANLPLARALRPGQLVLAALQETLLAHARGDWEAVPFWRMAEVSVPTLARRAARVAEASGTQVVKCTSVPGGGSAPRAAIPSMGVAVEGDITTELRRHDPSILARMAEGQTICDLRTVDPTEDALLTNALSAIASS